MERNDKCRWKDALRIIVMVERPRSLQEGCKELINQTSGPECPRRARDLPRNNSAFILFKILHFLSIIILFYAAVG